MKLGFVGLGQMGAPIATNLRKQGHALVVWNRSPAKAGDLVRCGATQAHSPREVAAESDIVFSMLADDAALRAVLEGSDGLLSGLRRESLHVSLSTISIAAAERTHRLHEEHRQRFISAVVFGRPEAAAAAKLFVVAAGEARSIDAARPFLESIGRRLFTVGERPSAANLVKLCGNFSILAAVETLAESMALAEKGGVPKALLLEILTETLFEGPVYRTYGAILAKDAYRPAAFPAPLGLKDMRLVGEAAESFRVAMPFLGVLRNHLLETIAKEGDDIDWSGIGLTIARNAGL